MRYLAVGWDSVEIVKVQVLPRDLNCELALIGLPVTVARPFFQGLAPALCLDLYVGARFVSAGQFGDAKIVLFEKLSQCSKLTVYLKNYQCIIITCDHSL